MPKYYNPQDSLSCSTCSLLIIGSKESFQCESTLSWIQTRFLTHHKNNGEPTAKRAKGTATWLSTIVQEMKTTMDDPISTEYWQTEPEGDTLQHWSIGLLPTAVGRHNIRARPHAITSLVKKGRKKDGKDPTVILLLEKEQDALAAGLAVAKGQSLYSRKTSNGLNAVGEKRDTSLHVVFSRPVETQLLRQLEAMSNGIQLAARLVDAPANECHTDAMVQEAVTVAKRYNAKHIVLRGEELRDKGLGGLYGVGKAAVNPPALVVLSYYPPGLENPETVPSVVMVGKGIVYDTGGLSMKTKATMPGMKRDMGGSAAILGAFEAAMASDLVHRRPLHAILCLAENAVASNATRPDDVHTMYSGRTVEINNTDAEGRLVLGDGVAFAVKHLTPAVIVDMATLTGAQGVATGRYFGALYCNNEELESLAMASGRESGDLVHPLPYAPEFFRPEFKSAVADMKNSVKDRSNAQVSCAGQFIGNHLGAFEDQGRWLHVDMASPAYTKSDERATGYGVALLHTLLGKLENEKP